MDPFLDPGMAEWLRQKQEALGGAVASDKKAQEDETRNALLMQFAQSYVQQRPVTVQPRQVRDAREQFGVETGLEGAARDDVRAEAQIRGQLAERQAGREQAAAQRAEDRRYRQEERAEDRSWREGESEKDRASRERAAGLSSGQRDRALDIQEENAVARREAADAKRRMVSDAQVKAIADYDRGMRVLEDIIREKPEIDTGPASNARNWVAQRLGVDDPQVSSYKAQVNDFLAQYIRSISGAATTDKERAFLLQNMPKLSDADDVFDAKAKKTMQRLRELRAVEVDLIRRQGKDTSQFEEAPVMERGSGMPPPPGAQPAEAGGTVTVIWKGKRKKIPAERLEEALAAGAQKVE